jgi:hypothetical protein
MMTFIFILYLLGAINVFIAEMKIEGGFFWSISLAATYPIWEAVGGLLWLLVMVEKLYFRIFRKKQ